MSRHLTASTSSGGMTPMWRRGPSGALVKVDPDPNEYVTPPRGTRGLIRLNGISEKFEMPDRFSDKPGATKTNVRVEFEIVKVSGSSAHLVGGRFTDLYTLSVHPKSNFGRLLGALRDRAIEPGEDIDYDAFIGTEFVAMTRLSDDGNYAGVSPDAIEPGKVKLSQYVNGNGAAPQPEPALVGAGGGEDPFEGAEEDDLN